MKNLIMSACAALSFVASAEAALSTGNLAQAEPVIHQVPWKKKETSIVPTITPDNIISLLENQCKLRGGDAGPVIAYYRLYSIVNKRDDLLAVIKLYAINLHLQKMKEEIIEVFSEEALSSIAEDFRLVTAYIKLYAEDAKMSDVVKLRIINTILAKHYTQRNKADIRLTVSLLQDGPVRRAIELSMAQLDVKIKERKQARRKLTI